MDLQKEERKTNPLDTSGKHGWYGEGKGRNQEHKQRTGKVWRKKTGKINSYGIWQDSLIKTEHPVKEITDKLFIYGPWN